MVTPPPGRTGGAALERWLDREVFAGRLTVEQARTWLPAYSWSGCIESYHDTADTPADDHCARQGIGVEPGVDRHPAGADPAGVAEVDDDGAAGW